MQYVSIEMKAEKNDNSNVRFVFFVALVDETDKQITKEKKIHSLDKNRTLALQVWDDA